MKRRKLKFESIDDVIAEIDRLHASGYQRLGNWSLGQMCDHIATLAEKSLAGFDTQLPIIFRMTVGKIIFHQVVLKGRFPRGIKAPAELTPKPAPANEDPSAQIQRCKLALQKVQRAAADQFQPHPFAGRVTAEQWRKAQAVHASYHLGFLIPNPSPGPSKR
jgi:hypothetical protein